MSLRTLHLRWSLRIAAAVAIAAVAGGALTKVTAERALEETDEEVAKAIARGTARRCRTEIAAARSDVLQACLEQLWEEDRVSEVRVLSLRGHVIGSKRWRGRHGEDRPVRYVVPDAAGRASALVEVRLTGEAIARARRAVLQDSILSAALFGAIAIVASFLVTRRVVRPLRLLADAESRIAAGDRTVHLPEESERELLELVQSFNHMVQAVRERDLALERRATDLAARVEALRRLQEAKERLTAMVVHDLRDPLSAAVLAVESVDSATLSLEDRELLAGAARRGRDLLDRIQDLLALARLESGRMPVKKEQTCLVEIVRRVLDDLAPLAAERGRPLRVDVPDRASLSGDPVLLGRVVGNLVSNALRFAPPGTGVDVRVVSDGDVVRLHVDDAGPGVPEAHRARIFEPFARLDEERAAGAGLGLAFSALVAREHGGTVEVSDAPSGGARFTLTLGRA